MGTNREARRFALTFPEIAREVGGDPAFAELDEGFLAKWTKLGITPLKALDVLMRMTTALGAYEKLAEDAGIKVDYKNPDRSLIAAATALMRKTQGSGYAIHQPLALTRSDYLVKNRSLNKTILQFQSFGLFAWDFLADNLWRQGIMKGDVKRVASTLFWMVGFQTAMEVATRSGAKMIFNFLTGGDDDDKDNDSLQKKYLFTLLGRVPLAGSIASAMVYGSDPVPLVAAFQKLWVSGFKRMLFGRRDETKLKGAANIVFQILNLFVGLGGGTTWLQAAENMVEKATGKGGRGGSNRRSSSRGGGI